MKLHLAIVALLRALDGGTAPVRAADAPRQMFEFNFVSRDGAGGLLLTKTGQRALFQAECIEALEQILAGECPPMVNGVERWLTSSGFLHAGDKTITARGKLWLASLAPEPESALKPQAAPEPHSFAARRSA